MYNFSSPSEIVGFMPGAGSANNLALPRIGGRHYMRQNCEVQGTCEGCVAEHNHELCTSLPACCYKGGHIWVLAESPLQQYHAALEQDIG